MEENAEGKANGGRPWRRKVRSELHFSGMSLGDSRIYRMREGKLEQLSTDHTYRHPGHIRSALVGYIGTEYADDFKKMDFYKLEYQKVISICFVQTV